MSEPSDAPLLKSLLALVDNSSIPPATSHIDDETLALFALGQLCEGDRAPVVEHLAECAACRRVASRLLSQLSGSADSFGKDVTVPGRSLKRLFRGRFAWALAAGLLAAITLWVYSSRSATHVAEAETYRKASNLLAAADFGQVQSVLASARRHGLRSDRLLNLEAQAMRRIPVPIALSLNGRLDDFGYALDGTVAREPRSANDPTSVRLALDRLAEGNDDSVDILLNRGHGLLSMGQARDASFIFQSATTRFPENPLAWLGLGIANFMLDDFKGAEEAFRRCLRLSPQSKSATINLAMTLGEEGKPDEATQEWRSLMEKGALVEAERKQIQTLLLQLGHKP